MFSKLIRKSKNFGSERYRKAALTSMMNLLSQCVQLATGLISVPLALNYVGVERFGIWMTLSTALLFITFSDFGVGIGAQDRITRAIGGGEYELARKVFFSALIFTVLLFILLMMASELFSEQLDLRKILSLSSPDAIAEIDSTVRMVVFVLGAGLISGVVQRTFNALQDGFWVALIQAIMRICSFLLLFYVVDKKMGLPALVFVVGGLSSVGLLLIGLPVLLYLHRWLLPSGPAFREMFDIDCLRDVLRVGVLGLGASLALYLVNNSIPMLMAGKYGAERVADYAILLKLISIPSLLLAYLLLPLWPAITEAKAKNDVQWIRSAYKRCSYITLGVSIVFSLIYLTLGQRIILHWTNNPMVVPSDSLLLATVFFMVIGFWNTLTSLILNGLSRYQSQATYGIAFALVFTSLAYLLPTSFEKDAIVWVVATGYAIRCAMMQFEVRSVLHAERRFA